MNLKMYILVQMTLKMNIIGLIQTQENGGMRHLELVTFTNSSTTSTHLINLDLQSIYGINNQDNSNQSISEINK